MMCNEEAKSLEAFRCETNELSSIKKVFAVISGKGGVGKSLVTSLLAVMMRKKGYKVGILDADITGPSIPKMFGAGHGVESSELGMHPVKTQNQIKLMSINLILDDSDSPVIWRGPLIAHTVKQFWKDVIWGDLDYLFIDMPPGTGDVPLTVFQSIPLDGIIIVTSPQDLVWLIVKKAYNMVRTMNIPIVGMVENMSYITCPDCGKKIDVFGESKSKAIAGEIGIKHLEKLPIDPYMTQLADKGKIEEFNKKYLSGLIDYIEKGSFEIN